jgi:hypothetical protein
MKREGHAHPPPPLNSFGGELGVGYEWPEFGGVEGNFPSNGEDNFYDDMESSDIHSNGGDLKNINGIKYVYGDDTWNQKQFIYDPKPQEFVGVSEPNIVWNQFPIMMQLFHLFLSFHILHDIVNETNPYAISRTSDGLLLGTDGWVLFTVGFYLRLAWLAI